MDETSAAIADAQTSKEAARAFAGHYGLSPREQDVLLLLLAGRTRAEVGAETGLADGTVRTHVTNIHKKVGVHSREELEMCIRDSVTGTPRRFASCTIGATVRSEKNAAAAQPAPVC